MKTGKIVSISDRFGFVSDSSGNSHYFNQRNLTQGLQLRDLSIGDKLSFKPKPGKRGMIANNVVKVEAHKGLVFGDRVIFARDADPFREHELPVEDSFVTIRSTWYRSPDAARNEIRSVMSGAGANAAVSMWIDRETFTQGNYHYTMHSCRASIGLYRVAKEVPTAEDAQKLTDESEEQAVYVRASLETSREMLDKARDKQTRKSPFMLIVAAVLFLVFIAILPV